ncbi:MAG: triose-phosphate isomerase [Patescibacteria group bacterium]|nr:triose-phosphate isomerase [Patescibacteria group bacterium]MDD4610484.1 triose-phosphate isomerase [Patescibacteria group bacterium]
MNKDHIIIANWKMKLGINETIELAKKIKDKFKKIDKGEVVVCPNFVALMEVKKILNGGKIKLGGQTVFWENRGAYTGEISPDILAEAGCEYVIIGHSERRKYVLENYEMIHKKVKTVLGIDNLIPIVCVGEDAKERKTDRRDFVLVDQLQEAFGGLNILKNQQVIVAYEPIWAIGSGVAIEPSEAEYAHKIVRLALNDIFGMQTVDNNFRIIYGGSIDTKNVENFVDLENLDGVLVGGGSLDIDNFYKIAQAIIG